MDWGDRSSQGAEHCSRGMWGESRSHRLLEEAAQRQSVIDQEVGDFLIRFEHVLFSRGKQTC